jgi:hypothetical protein
LGQRFKIKDLGDLITLFGMHITRDRVAMTVSIDQSHYVTATLDKHGKADFSPYALPMDHGFMSGIASTTVTPLTSHVRDVYSSLFGILQYAAICSRPDIATALNIFGSSQAHPYVQHFHAMEQVLRYLKGTINMHLTMGGGRVGMLNLSNSHAKHMQTRAMMLMGQVILTIRDYTWRLAHMPIAIVADYSHAWRYPPARLNTIPQPTQRE